jgi:hypothetical protein
MATRLPVEGRPSYSIPGDGSHIKDADADSEMVGAVETLIGQDGSSYISRGKISMATLSPEMQNDNVSVGKAERTSCANKPRDVNARGAKDASNADHGLDHSIA